MKIANTPKDHPDLPPENGSINYVRFMGTFERGFFIWEDKGINRSKSLPNFAKPRFC